MLPVAGDVVVQPGGGTAVLQAGRTAVERGQAAQLLLRVPGQQDGEPGGAGEGDIGARGQGQPQHAKQIGLA